MLSEIEVPSVNGQISLEFEEDILVFGYLAVHWSDSGPAYGPVVRGWGNDLRKGSIPVNGGNDVYTAGKVFSDKCPAALAAYGPGRLGLLITKTFNARGGNKSQKSYWVPLESLKKVKMIIEGCEA